MKSILRYCVRVQNNRSNKQPKNITIEVLRIQLTLTESRYILQTILQKTFDCTFVYE